MAILLLYITMKSRSMNNNLMNTSTASQLQVSTQARLHFGFLDMNGSLRRYYGSFGVAIKDIGTTISMQIAEDIQISGSNDNEIITKAKQYASKVIEYYQLGGGVHIQLNSVIPSHIGLGSGTQLALAIGSGIIQLYKQHKEITELASVCQRGKRSGIGIGTFIHGGFILDSGCNQDRDISIPIIINRIPFPEDWCFLLIFDDNIQGMHGQHEQQIFATIKPMDKALSSEVCHIMLMQLLPALIEQECRIFGQALSHIQMILGDYFATIQGGRYISPHMHNILQKLRELGACGIGQSSWGPTSFALFANSSQANDVLQAIQSSAPADIRFMLTSGHNQPAKFMLK